MRMLLAVTASLGLGLAATSGAMACSFKNKDVTAEAPMTSFETAEKKVTLPEPTPVEPTLPVKIDKEEG